MTTASSQLFNHENPNWRLWEFVIVGDLVAKWLKSFHVDSIEPFSI